MAAATSAAGPARYRVVAPLGEGAAGRVELAHCPGGRLVALTTVHPRLAADPDFLERFRQEVTAARSVDDVHTAAVLDADPGAQPPWLVSEFCAGPSLVDTVSTLGPLDSAALGTLGAALAGALTAVHAAGLVHRDLKPAHVVITRDGPQVLGFGLAKLVKGAVDVDGKPLKGAGGPTGKLGFLAPEQLTRDMAGQVGPPADVFALGALLVLSSTGRNPFGSGSAAQVLHRTLNEPPDLLGVPDEAWLGFLRRCLAPAPADRPTVPEVLDWTSRRAGQVPWWQEEPILGVIREHEEATAELVAAGPQPPEPEDEIPEAFRTPRRATDTRPRPPADAPPPGRRDVPRTEPEVEPEPEAPVLPAPRRRRFLAWAGAAVTAVTGSAAAAVTLLDGGPKPEQRPAGTAAPGPGWRSGRGVWSRALDASPGYGGELLRHGDALYVRAGGALTKLDASTGTVRWRYEEEHLAGVRVQGDMVFVLRLPLREPGIVALDAVSGARRWASGPLVRNPFRPFVPNSPSSELDGASAHLTVSATSVCLVTHAADSTDWERRDEHGRRWRAYGFAVRDGRPLWHRAGTVTGAWAVHQHGGRLAVATSERRVSLREPADGPLIVLRDRDGTVEREVPGGAVHPQAHAGSSGIRYYPGESAVAAVDLATGTRLWSRPAGDGATVTPTATAGLVHTGTQGDLRALDAVTGHQLWVRGDVCRIDADDAAPPLVADGLLYASGPDPALPAAPGRRSDGWGLHALDPRTGALEWAMPVERMGGVRAAAGGGLVHLCVGRELVTLRGPGAS
ncbi:PQQ-binding-like beta-propeller repeat protein [Streptomyces sp. NPDC058657]|uniref:protein kinase domain-containing protein n=1 Tax=unclassified Streptomyces TaxID=2593676 RepID=UPI00364C2DB6